VAHILGLGYPGGPRISKLAESGAADRFEFPRFRAKDGSAGFSFSGLKTAVLYHVRGQDAQRRLPAPRRSPTAPTSPRRSSRRRSTCSSTRRCARRRARTSRRSCGRRSACNKRLRRDMTDRAARAGRRAIFPSPAYCTDNAVMIAGLGYEEYAAGRIADLALDATSR
jgi:N6-L-threonylcarbamoyladenine synthase